jgi:hypothetical protein
MVAWQLARIVSLKKNACYINNVSSRKGEMNNCFGANFLAKTVMES